MSMNAHFKSRLLTDNLPIAVHFSSNGLSVICEIPPVRPRTQIFNRPRSGIESADDERTIHSSARSGSRYNINSIDNGRTTDQLPAPRNRIEMFEFHVVVVQLSGVQGPPPPRTGWRSRLLFEFFRRVIGLQRFGPTEGRKVVEFVTGE